MFWTTHNALDMSDVMSDTPPNRVLREVTKQPEQGYNTLDVSNVTPVITLNTSSSVVGASKCGYAFYMSGVAPEILMTMHFFTPSLILDLRAIYMTLTNNLKFLGANKHC